MIVEMLRNTITDPCMVRVGDGEATNGATKRDNGSKKWSKSVDEVSESRCAEGVLKYLS